MCIRDSIEKALEKSEMAMNECKNISEEMKGCVNKIAIMRYKACLLYTSVP